MSSVLLLNVLLALAWVALSGDETFEGFLFGFALSMLVMAMIPRPEGTTRYLRKVGVLLRFIGFYARELVVSSVRVAYDIVTPPLYVTPAILALPLDAETDLEISLLANLITMTPGTLSLDVSEDRKTLYVHCMYVKDVEEARRELKDVMERRVLELLR